MSRFAFVTWDGGGNIPPAVGIAQELAARGHHVTLVGYASQREPFAQHGFAFGTLETKRRVRPLRGHRSSQRLAWLIRNVLACPEHPDDIRSAAEESEPDVLIVDFLMQGALAALAGLPVPGAVLVHSTISGLPPPESPMGTALLTATNQLRGLVTAPRRLHRRSRRGPDAAGHELLGHRSGADSYGAGRRWWVAPSARMRLRHAWPSSGGATSAGASSWPCRTSSSSPDNRRITQDPDE